MQSFFSACPLCGSGDSREHVSFPELRFVTCAACGLLYKSHEQPGLAASLSKAYDGGYFEKGRAQYLKRWDHRVAKCRRQLLMCLEFAPHAKSVLDVGCSAGYVLAAGESLGLRATGIDYAAWAAKLGHERGYSTAAASLTHLPFRDGSFDLVTAKHTLEHVPTPKLGLSELARVLKPGGVAFVVVPDAWHWQLHLRKKSGGYFKPQRLGWQHHVYYDVTTLRRGLEGAGLQVVSDDKAMLRRRLSPVVWEWARVAGLKVWTTFSKVTRLRREIQLIATKPA